MYAVLSPSPQTQKTDQQFRDPESGRTLHWHRITTWPQIGTANSYEEARAKFGGRPVLQWIGKTH